MQKKSVRYLFSVCLFVCLSAGLGCSDKKQTVSLTKKSVILAFGDSLTQGTGASISNSYPNHLADFTGLTVLNKGIAGETSAAGLKRLKQLLINLSSG